MRALEFITGPVIYNLIYTYKFQLKTTRVDVGELSHPAMHKRLFRLGMDSFIYGRNCCQIFRDDVLAGGLSLLPKLRPGGGFFFFNLKKFESRSF